MVDDTEVSEAEEVEDAPCADTLAFPWEGGDIVILDIGQFAERFKALAVRTIFKTGEIEILSEDGKGWKKVSRHLKLVDPK